MGTCTDIEDLKRTGTKLQEAMRAQEALLYEVNHRVKNSLQVVMSLLALQSNRAADPQVQQSLSDARSRIGVIASIHQSLYQTGTHGEIELCDYLRSLTNQTLAVHGNLQTIGLRSDCEDRILLPISQAVPIALIVSELLTNAIKHAFEGPGGELHLRVHRHGSDLLIAIGDNGRGLPSDFDVQKSSGVGMRVVTALAKQLRGKLEIDSSNTGASFTIVVPLEA
jgi:two-component sensor histidine kinase